MTRTTTRSFARAFWALLISVVLAFTVACSSVSQYQLEPNTPTAVTATEDVDAPVDADETAEADTGAPDLTDPFDMRADPDDELPMTPPTTPAPVPDGPPGCPTN